MSLRKGRVPPWGGFSCLEGEEGGEEEETVKPGLRSHFWWPISLWVCLEGVVVGKEDQRNNVGSLVYDFSSIGKISRAGASVCPCLHRPLLTIQPNVILL